MIIDCIDVSITVDEFFNHGNGKTYSEDHRCGAVVRVCIHVRCSIPYEDLLQKCGELEKERKMENNDSDEQLVNKSQASGIHLLSFHQLMAGLLG